MSLIDLGYTQHQIDHLRFRGRTEAVLTSIAEHHEFLKSKWLTHKEIVNVGSFSGGATNISSLAENFERLEALGFSLPEIIALSSRTGARLVIETLLSEWSRLSKIGLNCQLAVKLLNNKGSHNRILMLVDNFEQFKEKRVRLEYLVSTVSSKTGDSMFNELAKNYGISLIKRPAFNKSKPYEKPVKATPLAIFTKPAVRGPRLSMPKGCSSDPSPIQQVTEPLGVLGKKSSNSPVNPGISSCLGKARRGSIFSDLPLAKRTRVLPPPIRKHLAKPFEPPSALAPIFFPQGQTNLISQISNLRRNFLNDLRKTVNFEDFSYTIKVMANLVMIVHQTSTAYCHLNSTSVVQSLYAYLNLINRNNIKTTSSSPLFVPPTTNHVNITLMRDIQKKAGQYGKVEWNRLVFEESLELFCNQILLLLNNSGQASDLKEKTLNCVFKLMPVSKESNDFKDLQEMFNALMKSDTVVLDRLSQ